MITSQQFNSMKILQKEAVAKCRYMQNMIRSLWPEYSILYIAGYFETASFGLVY